MIHPPKQDESQNYTRGNPHDSGFGRDALNTMSAPERRSWAEQVQKQMNATLPDADEVVVLAGNRYRENLMSYLRKRFPKVTVPMDGLTIGRQLNWLDNAAAL